MEGSLRHRARQRRVSNCVSSCVPPPRGQVWGASFRKVYQQNSCMSYPWEQPLVQIQIGSLAQQTSQYLRDFLVNQESKAQVWASYSSLSCIFHPQIALIFWNKYKQVRVAGLASFNCFLLLCLLPVCSCLSASFCLQVPLYVSATTQECISRDNWS